VEVAEEAPVSMVIRVEVEAEAATKSHVVGTKVPKGARRAINATIIMRKAKVEADKELEEVTDIVLELLEDSASILLGEDINHNNIMEAQI
jgi:diphthamide synthase (EF-2-diphthine--ammonia ligase)